MALPYKRVKNPLLLISRWALIFVVKARQKAPGLLCTREEDFSLLTFVYIPSFIYAYLLSFPKNVALKPFAHNVFVNNQGTLITRLYERADNRS
jgi:hypothetical protein